MVDGLCPFPLSGGGIGAGKITVCSIGNSSNARFMLLPGFLVGPGQNAVFPVGQRIDLDFFRKQGKFIIRNR